MCSKSVMWQSTGIILILCLMSYFDIKHKRVEDYLQLLLLMLVVNNTTIIKLQIAIGIYIVMLLLFKYIEKYIGGADIKLLLILFLLPIDILTCIMLATTCAIIYIVLKKEKEIYFIPFITLGYIGSMFVKF